MIKKFFLTLIVLIGAHTIALGSDLGPNAIVKLSLGSLRSHPAHASEMVTQALMGTPIFVVDSLNPDWLWAELPDGYVGWIPRASVWECGEECIETWRSSKRYVVTNPRGTFMVADTLNQFSVVTDLVCSAILQSTGFNSGSWFEMATPDGRIGFVAANDVCDFDSWKSVSFSVDRALNVVSTMVGSPYMWGGTSSKGVDCSGLVKTIFFDQAIILPRDASKQALVGEAVTLDIAALRPGDLLFYSPDTIAERVTHVAFYVGDSQIIHASGSVRRNSIDPASDSYFVRKILGARRMVKGTLCCRGVIPVAKHPWY